MLEQADRGGAATRSWRQVAETHAHTECCLASILFHYPSF
jgi:hypothetical protein